MQMHVVDVEFILSLLSDLNWLWIGSGPASHYAEHGQPISGICVVPEAIPSRAFRAAVGAFLAHDVLSDSGCVQKLSIRFRYGDTRTELVE